MSSPGMQRDNLSAAVGLLAGRELLEEESLCLNVRGRADHCTHCREACHSGALSLSPDALEVDREKCTGCGGCVPACPAGALRLTGFSATRFLDAVAGETTVHIHCTESTDSGGGVVVPCFKVLDARLLTSAVASGTQAFHLHGLNRCADCRHGGALRIMAQTRCWMKRWLGEDAPALQPASRDTAAPEGPRRRQDQTHLSRRSFLLYAGTRATQETVGWLVPAEQEDDIPDLPFFQNDPDDVRQAHPYQTLLAARVADVPWKRGAALPWQLRTLAEHCTACLACGQRCPTGALLARQDHDTQGISFEPALCTNCGLCETLCPVDAVRTRPARRVEQVQAPRSVLMMRRLQACARCRTPFLPNSSAETTCPICRNEQDLDDEWLAMLEG